jgi:hypothetical protein
LTDLKEAIRRLRKAIMRHGSINWHSDKVKAIVEITIDTSEGRKTVGANRLHNWYYADRVAHVTGRYRVTRLRKRTDNQ